MRKGPTFSKATQSTGAAAAPARAKDMMQTENREARLAELRDQYVSGTYKIDAAELSRKIVDSHLKK